MVSNKCSNEIPQPTLTNQKSRSLEKQSPKPSSSNKATHGSLKSASASGSQGRGENWGGKRDAGSGSGQRDAWALQKWMEQAPRDEPWRPGSRRV